MQHFLFNEVSVNQSNFQEKQYIASNPAYSGWVSASAGTGKTKVLVDRLLRILLDGASPETIVCLTFTNAAAHEMHDRLLQKLQHWAMCDEQELKKQLENLCGQSFEQLLSRAKMLFTTVLDSPTSMYVGTIHGFCQKILSLFPLEAGISPQFQLMDEEQSQRLLKEVQHEVFSSKNEPLLKHIRILSGLFSFDQLISFLNSAQQNWHDFLNFKKSHPLEEYKKHLKNTLQVDKCPFKLIDFQKVSVLLCQSSETMDQKLGNNLQHATLEELFSIFLTQDGTPRKRLCSQNFSRNFPDDAQFLIDSADGVFQQSMNQKNAQIADATVSFLFVLYDLLDRYESRKNQQGLLDFQDMIVKTHHLLNSPEAGWVFHKLDTKIHHLLVDEAQDTSPLQWAIISQLADNMLVNPTQSKSFFVVGDLKQSIYSFQGARPDLFQAMQKELRQKFKSHNWPWFDVGLDVSFRSTEAVLKGVDETFTQYPDGVYEDNMTKHHAFRQKHPGRVSLLPLIPKKEQEAAELQTPWPMPVAYENATTPTQELANQITQRIQKLLDSSVVLPSTNQNIEPDDIMVLVRKRGPFVTQLIQSLKQANIPVSGLDRLMLKEHLAIQDLVAFGKFLSLPHDDYSLACVLKSPLVNCGKGLTEEQIFQLCHKRAHTVWQSLWEHAKNDDIFHEVYKFLHDFLSEADYTPLQTLYAKLLHYATPFFVARFGEECLDVLEEFQTVLWNFSKNNSPSLHGFLNFIENNTHVIKRDTSSKRGVRVLTIHGSKGLQAPIVILPDSTDAPTLRNENFLWGYTQGKPIFLLKPKSQFETPQTQVLKQQCLDGVSKEHQRLFYVALTRAQDQLYLGGFQQKHSRSWYEKVYEALKPFWVPGADGGYEYASEVFFENRNDQKKMHEFIPLPEWAKTPVELSFQADNEPQTDSMKRGILIHKLLEFLGSVLRDRRLELANDWKEKNLLDESTIGRVLSILDHPDYAPLFGERSIAEVSLIHDGQLQRIDRVAFVDDAIHFVDFKTHKKIPNTPAQVPADIMNQMTGYSKALKDMYNQQTVRGFVLWTEGPTLMEIAC